MRYYIFLLLVGAVLTGCDKSDDLSKIQPVANFEYTVDKGTVTFINKSTGADVYAWEFGGIANGVSTQENPTYTYLKGGSYNVEVTLYAGQGKTGVNNYISKIIELNDVPPSILIDGDFTDWESVPFVEGIVGNGSLQRVKVDGSGAFINIYLEGTNAMNFSIPRFWIDLDGNATTGLIDNNLLTQGRSGIEVLVEGLSYYNFGGTSGSNQWSWAGVAEPGNFLIKSNIVSISADVKVIEMSLSKDQLNKNSPGKLSSTGINIIVQDLNAGWSTVGQMAFGGALPASIPIQFKK